MTVLVTGPHRSGTTFVAKCIAHDMGIDFVPEERIEFSNLHRLRLFVDDELDYVVQCPWVAPFIHLFPDAEVVWVRRPHNEILTSRRRMFNSDGERMPWLSNEAQLRKMYNAVDGDLLSIQEAAWLDQMAMLPNAREVNYHDYDDHPLHRDHRDGFHFRQTDGAGIVPKAPKGDPIPCL